MRQYDRAGPLGENVGRRYIGVEIGLFSL
jgi:hypothetical protein